MLDRIKFWMRDEDGATAVEYGILVALIAAVIIGVVIVLGGQVEEGFCDVATSLESADVGETGDECA